MSDFWARKTQGDFWGTSLQNAAARQQQQEQADMAAQLVYRNTQLGAGSQEWIDCRQAQVERNKAAAGAMTLGYGNLDAVREAAHLRAVQAYHATAHRTARGDLARVEVNPVDMGQYELNRPRASYSDVF
ncbi:hypothetical protein ACFYUL_17880 [Streptomyces sp. NPDC004311]|uniref:hypothetical protein n=1 Tax=Streptomyces sp. NPDC004311 TaxID=3364698 RepID=UPI0036B6B0D9